MSKLEPIAGLVANLEDYLGLWAMNLPTFRALVDRVNAMDLHLHVQKQLAASADAEASLEAERREVFTRDSGQDDLAVISLTGTLMKRASSLSAGTSTIRARQQVRAARNAADVSGTLLVIDSPGGTVAGIQDLADEIRQHAEVKPIVVFGEDLVASAAFWAASQANAVYANSTALIGSIGVFSVVVDSSGAAEQEGLQVHVLTTGDHKGVGVPGAPVSPEQLAELQRTVDTMGGFFNEAVQTGRQVPTGRMDTLTDGRVHIAAAAEQLGLIDGVRTYAGARQELRTMIDRSNRTMADKAEAPAQPVAATYRELVAACPNADADFIVDCQKSDLTAEQARDRWLEQLQERVEAAEQKAAQAEADKAEAQEQASQQIKGVQPVTVAADPEESGTAVERFGRTVTAFMQAGRSRDQAILQAKQQDPKLYQDYLLETNPGAKARRMLSEKFDQ